MSAPTEADLAAWQELADRLRRVGFVASTEAMSRLLAEVRRTRAVVQAARAYRAAATADDACTHDCDESGHGATASCEALMDAAVAAGLALDAALAALGEV